MSLRSAHCEIRALTARRASHQLRSYACLIVERYSSLSASVARSTASLVGAILNALHYNRREDEYGGSFEHRARIHLEIYQAVRKAVGDDFPVLIKLNCRDFAENGLSLEESLKVGGMLADAGLDAIELSGGLLTGGKLSPSRPGISSEEQEAYFRQDAQAFKKEINIPLILVGGIRSWEVAERLVGDGVADYISMSRPFIREPALINRWKGGDRRRALCKSDNLCFGPGVQGQGIHCVTAEQEKGKIG